MTAATATLDTAAERIAALADGAEPDPTPEPSPAPAPAPPTDEPEPAPDRDASSRRRARTADGKRTGKAKRTTGAGADEPAPERPAGKRSARTGAKLSLQRDLEQLLATVGTVVSAIEPFDGAVIIANAESTARALDDAAKKSDAIHRTLSLLTSGAGGSLGLVMALVPIVLPILHHHGLIPSTPAVDLVVAGMTPAEARQAAEAREAVRAAFADAAQQTHDGDGTPGPGVTLT